MKKQKPSDTRGKLLTAASVVFAEKGFRDTTVDEICRRAGANIAAVNYHFGSKDALYQEAWRHSFSESVKMHPIDGGVSENATAEERLRGQVKALIERVGDENNRDFVISQMEVLNPTGLLEEVMMSALNPLREKTMAIMGELLGPTATQQEIVFCETSLLAMCLHPMLMKKVKQRKKTFKDPLVIDDLGAFGGHVIRFALAGIAAIREKT